MLTKPENQEALDRQLTGELGTYGQPVDATPKLRPPSWSRISQADIDRMNRYRS